MKSYELAEIVRKELGRQGTNPYQAAKKAGLPDNSIRYILEGKNPSFSRVCEVLEYLNIPLKIGLKTADTQSQSHKIRENQGQYQKAENLNKITFNSEIAAALGMPATADLSQILEKIKKIKEESHFGSQADALRQTLDRWLKCGNQPALKEVDMLNDGSASAVPYPAARSVPAIEYEAAAGGGHVNLDEVPQRGVVWFRRDWLDEHGIDSTRCAVIRVAGESMEPTLAEGCSILIDRARVKRKAGYIYVIMTYDGLIVKRLEKKGNVWRLLSDNPAWGETDFPRDSEIVGRVMWAAKSLA